VKTSLLFLEKKHESEISDYPIFFGRITKIGYQGNKNGSPQYKKNMYGQVLTDHAGNKVLDENFTDILHSYRNYLADCDFTSTNSFSLMASQLNSRFDFDYYSPETRQLFLNSTNKTYKLGDICEIVKSKSDKLKISNGSVKYIELSDINTQTYEIISASSYNIHELPSRASYELLEGDIITAVAGNSVGTKKHTTAYVSKDYYGCICTNGFRVLRNIKINPFYLLYYMKTDKFLKQMYMYRTGAAIPAVSDADLGNIIIELPGDDTIRDITAKMQHIFFLRNKAQEEFNNIFFFKSS
jgi:type I restriction enzyme M protein